MPYQAGDNAGPLNRTLTISVPSLSWVQGAIYGTLRTFTFPNSWIPAQDFTSDQAAQLFSDILDTLVIGVPMIGQIMTFTQNNMEYVNRDPSLGPTNLLPCDGRSLSATTYATLYNLIGTTFGGSGGSFNLPDLRGRVIVGEGTGSGLTPRAVGDSFGEETHQLITSETPSHSHTDLGHIHGVSDAGPNVTTIGPGAPEPTAIPVPASTTTGNANLTNTGGDGAHNNMQPSLVLYYYIQVQ